MSRPPRTRRTALAAAAAAVIVAAAVALLVHRSGDGAPPAQAAPPGDEGVAQLWHNLAQCLRTHGHPQFKDPVIDSRGNPDFGTQGAEVKRAVLTLGVSACRAQLAAMPASDHRRPATAAELHQRVLFSRCMRAHGLPDWPDPQADGTFALPERLLRKRGTRTQVRACQPLLGDAKGIEISPSSLPPGSKRTVLKANGE
jgi:hypothetical protein